MVLEAAVREKDRRLAINRRRRKARRLALNRETHQHSTLADALSKGHEDGIVKRYVRAYIAADADKEISTDGSAYNVSVVTLDRDFDAFVKRTTLIASHLAIGHDNGGSEHCLYSEPAPNGSNGFYIHCPDLVALGKMLRHAEPLVRKGKLTYVPAVYTRFQELNDHPLPQGPNFRMTSSFDLLLKGGVLTQLSSDISLGSRLAIPLMRLNLPILENVSLRDYSKIVVEESEAYSAFSNYLRSRLLDLDGEEEERAIQREAAKIDIDLHDGLRESRADLERLTRRNAVQATGATVAFCAATLIAVAGPAFAHYVGLVGASGGAVGLAAAANEYVNDRSAARLKPFYFLWLLEREALRHD